MRNITRLELAAFERLQRANWPPHARLPSDEEIDARLELVWQGLLVSARHGALTLDAMQIAGLNATIADTLNVSRIEPFRQPSKWHDYVSHLHETGACNVRDTAARLIVRLHWHHLHTFGLVTAWMHISALGVQQGSGPLSLQSDSTSCLIRDLSAAGPPHRDPRPFHAAMFPEG